jgi:hypothetical protein
MLALYHVGGHFSVDERGNAMRMKAIAFALIIGIAVALAVGMRSANRADAANGNCYSDQKGPATPTICS